MWTVQSKDTSTGILTAVRSSPSIWLAVEGVWIKQPIDSACSCMDGRSWWHHILPDGTDSGNRLKFMDDGFKIESLNVRFTDDSFTFTCQCVDDPHGAFAGLTSSTCSEHAYTGMDCDTDLTQHGVPGLLREHCPLTCGDCGADPSVGGGGEHAGSSLCEPDMMACMVDAACLLAVQTHDDPSTPQNEQMDICYANALCRAYYDCEVASQGGGKASGIAFVDPVFTEQEFWCTKLDEGQTLARTQCPALARACAATPGCMEGIDAMIVNRGNEAILGSEDPGLYMYEKIITAMSAPGQALMRCLQEDLSGADRADAGDPKDCIRECFEACQAQQDQSSAAVDQHAGMCECYMACDHTACDDDWILAVVAPGDDNSLWETCLIHDVGGGCDDDYRCFSGSCDTNGIAPCDAKTRAGCVAQSREAATMGFPNPRSDATNGYANCMANQAAQGEPRFMADDNLCGACHWVQTGEDRTCEGLDRATQTAFFGCTSDCRVESSHLGLGDFTCNWVYFNDEFECSRNLQDYDEKTFYVEVERGVRAVGVCTIPDTSGPVAGVALPYGYYRPVDGYYHADMGVFPGDARELTLGSSEHGLLMYNMQYQGGLKQRTVDGVVHHYYDSAALCDASCEMQSQQGRGGELCANTAIPGGCSSSHARVFVPDDSGDTLSSYSWIVTCNNMVPNDQCGDLSNSTRRDEILDHFLRAIVERGISNETDMASQVIPGANDRWFQSHNGDAYAVIGTSVLQSAWQYSGVWRDGIEVLFPSRTLGRDADWCAEHSDCASGVCSAPCVSATGSSSFAGFAAPPYRPCTAESGASGVCVSGSNHDNTTAGGGGTGGTGPYVGLPCAAVIDCSIDGTMTCDMDPASATAYSCIAMAGGTGNTTGGTTGNTTGGRR